MSYYSDHQSEINAYIERNRVPEEMWGHYDALREVEDLVSEDREKQS